MFGLTVLGSIHTLIGLIAVLAGTAALLSKGRILPDSRLGKTYIGLTVLTCLSAFGIYQRGGFGDGHVLAVLTLGVLLAVMVIRQAQLGGRFSLYLETGLLSFSYFLHFIPATVETSTRLPIGAPWASGPEDPKLQPVIAMLFLLWLVGLVVQMRMLRQQRRYAATA